MKKIIIAVLLFPAAGCIFSTGRAPAAAASQSKDTPETLADTMDKNGQSLVYRESASVNKQPELPGVLINQIDFNVKTSNRKAFEDGMIHSISLEHPEKEMGKLIGKDSVVITYGRISIIIDYPLTVPDTFNMVAGNNMGFTRKQLLEVISKEYHRIYKEEEATAKMKTVPLAQRKMYNRNTTDGKYGIWGHDLGDLVLDDILVYKNKKGELWLMLEIDS